MVLFMIGWGTASTNPEMYQPFLIIGAGRTSEPCYGNHQVRFGLF
ncbi:NAD synthetase [Erythrobacter sp. SD-21]|nr:NAD synthetase [Erythrobacter sp. SD-21]